MSWQIYRGLRKLTLAIGCAVRNIFHLKSFIGPTPQIMLFNLHNDLLNRYVHGTLNILFINTLGFFFFNGKCYSSFPDHKTSREVSIRSRWLILRIAVIFFNGNYCSCPVSSGIVNITPILWFVYSLLLPGFFFFFNMVLYNNSSNKVYWWVSSQFSQDMKDRMVITREVPFQMISVFLKDRTYPRKLQIVNIFQTL